MSSRTGRIERCRGKALGPQQSPEVRANSEACTHQCLTCLLPPSGGWHCSHIGFATFLVSLFPVTGSRISFQLTASSLPPPSSAFPNSTPSSFRAVLK